MSLKRARDLVLKVRRSILITRQSSMRLGVARSCLRLACLLLAHKQQFEINIRDKQRGDTLTIEVFDKDAIGVCHSSLSVEMMRASVGGLPLPAQTT